jgi:hypothetical protein
MWLDYEVSFVIMGANGTGPVPPGSTMRTSLGTFDLAQMSAAPS